MANLVSITPVMTSNSTPSPYVVSSTSGADAWKVFDGTNATSSDCWIGDNSDDSVQIDFGTKTYLSGIDISTTNGNSLKILEVHVYGSSDTLTWDTLHDETNITDLSTDNVTKRILFDSLKRYRYYKFQVISDTYASAGEISLLVDEDDIPEPVLTINKTLKANMPSFINPTYGDELHITEDGAMYINKNDGTFAQIGVDTATIGRIETLENSTMHTHSNKDILDKIGYDTNNGLTYDGVAFLTTGKAYVDQKVASIVDSAPETLDTLVELSNAMGDDPDFTTTINNQIDAKANKTDITNLQTTLETTIATTKAELQAMTGDGSMALNNKEW